MDDDLGVRAASALGTLYLRRTRSDLYDELLAGMRTPVDATTYPVLNGIERLGPIGAAELALEIGLDRSVTSRHATRLEEDGLIRRAPDPHDGRVTLLHLTPTGRRAIGSMRRRLAARLNDVLGRWPAREAAAFVRGLERFAGELADG